MTPAEQAAEALFLGIIALDPRVKLDCPCDFCTDGRKFAQRHVDLTMKAGLPAAVDAAREQGRREGAVQALRAAADDWHGGPTGVAPVPIWWLTDRADRIEAEAGDQP